MIALKIPAFLGVLCLVTSPAFAKDIIYMKCQLDVLKQTKDLKTLQILETTRERDTTVSMVDLVNKRIIGSKSTEWQEVEIVDGVASYQNQEMDDGVLVSMNASFQVDPPGRMKIQVTANNGDYQSLINIGGDCREAPASLYEAERSQ